MSSAPAVYWQPELECLDREELEQLQLERLGATLTRAYMNVPFYRKRFDEVGFDPDDFRSFDDLRRLPFTTKAELRENQPYGLFAVPLREVVRIHASSGTTGMSTAVGYTRNDVKAWTNLTARVLTAGGVSKDDVVQIAFDYGLFTGAFGLHYGAERIGASVIPASTANVKRQIAMIQDYRTSALVGTPSYALNIAEAMIEANVQRNALALRFALLGSEPWSESMRREIEDKLKVVATDNYGLSEVMGPGVAGECLEKNGLHLNEDHFFVEVLDPETLRPAAPGAVGELVITTLCREAMPVVRYRTRDLTTLLATACPCGRTFHRMSRVRGRTDDMLMVGGVKVFPSEIEAILLDVDGTTPHYQIVVNPAAAGAEPTVLVEVTERTFSDEMKVLAQLRERIRARLAEELGIAVNVKLVGLKTLQRFEGKASRVVRTSG